MNKELITKLIDRAKEASGNAYCPYTSVPIGCALLTEENIYCGCNIESKSLTGSLTAGEVATAKAISEGQTTFVAVCFYSDEVMPFPSGRSCELIADFAPLIRIIVANKETYSLHYLHELFPFNPELPEVEVE
jgi:cytidine deaminase